MPTPTALLDRALAALDEAATEAVERPIAHTKALAFVFAFLSSMAEDKEALAELRRRDPGAYFTEPKPGAFVDLWKELAAPLRDNGGALDFGRRQTINNLAGYIFRMFGRVR
jgi:hypothetical protein